MRKYRKRLEPAPADNWYKFTREGLKIYRLPSWEEYYRLGSLLEFLEHGIPMIVGDWLNLGDDKFREQYAQAVQFIPRAYHTIAKWKSICKKVPMKQRRAGLHYSHYQAIAPLEPCDQLKWQDLALKYGWSARNLLNEIQSSETTSNREIKKGVQIQRFFEDLYKLIDDKQDERDLNKAYNLILGVLSRLTKKYEPQAINQSQIIHEI